MTGGIYCECLIGHPVQPALLASVNKRSYRVLGEAALSEKEVQDFLRETIFAEAKAAFSRRASDRSHRGFTNETVDLMHSMGLAVYYNGRLLDDYQFGGGHSERTPGRGKHTGVDPNTRFRSFVYQYAGETKTKGLNGYSVVFVATMPYAVRLEFERVDKTGGYNKRVMSGFINTVVNQFGKAIPVKQVEYGYIMERGKSVKGRDSKIHPSTGWAASVAHSRG